MYSWLELEAAAPEIAAFGAQRLDGKLAYLATVREDAKPRLHPVTPIIGVYLKWSGASGDRWRLARLSGVRFKLSARRPNGSV